MVGSAHGLFCVTIVVLSYFFSHLMAMDSICKLFQAVHTRCVMVRVALVFDYDVYFHLKFFDNHLIMQIFMQKDYSAIAIQPIVSFYLIKAFKETVCLFHKSLVPTFSSKQKLDYSPLVLS